MAAMESKEVKLEKRGDCRGRKEKDFGGERKCKQFRRSRDELNLSMSLLSKLSLFLLL